MPRQSTLLKPSSFFWSADCGNQEVQPAHCIFIRMKISIFSHKSPHNPHKTEILYALLCWWTPCCQNQTCPARRLWEARQGLHSFSIRKYWYWLVFHLHPVKLIQKLSCAHSLFLHRLKLKFGFLFDRFLISYANSMTAFSKCSKELHLPRRSPFSEEGSLIHNEGKQSDQHEITESISVSSMSTTCFRFFPSSTMPAISILAVVILMFCKTA